MKRIVLKLVTGLIILSFCPTCYYLKDDELNPPEGQCDTTNITFNGTILNILGANCLLCHSNVAAIDNGSGIYLDTYEGVMEADLKQCAIVVASLVYHLSMRNDMLPRFVGDSMPLPEK